MSQERLDNLRKKSGYWATRPAWLRCVVAIVMVAGAVRAMFLLALGTRAVYVTFFPAVIIVALYGGLTAGLLATVLSALLADYF